MKKYALRYKLLRMAQASELVDPRMKETETEFKDQAKGLFEEFCKFSESKCTDIFIGMQKLVDRKISYIPHG